MRIGRNAGITGAVLAVLAAMALLTACAGNSAQAETRNTAGPDSSGVKAVEAVIPDPVAEGTDAERFVLGDAHWDWWKEYREKVDISRDQQEGMEQYYELIQKELLANAAEENAVCSPLNIYIALSMLAEVTDGNSRAQVLEALGVADVETLRDKTYRV